MIRRKRVWLLWTQRQLEAESGIDQTVISRLENGKQYGLRWSRLAELVDALGGLDIDASAQPARVRGPVPRPRIDLADGEDLPEKDETTNERLHVARRNPVA